MDTEIKTLCLYVFQMNKIYFIVATTITVLVKHFFMLLIAILEEVIKLVYNLKMTQYG